MNDVTAGSFSFYTDGIFKMYTIRLDKFEVDTAANKTYFKAKVLWYFGTNLQEQIIWRKMILMFNEGMQQAHKGHLEHRDYSKEAKILAMVSRIIMQDIFDLLDPSFGGNQNSKWQEYAVPLKIKNLVSLILYVNKMKKNTGTQDKQTAIKIAQMMFSHWKKKNRSYDTSTGKKLLQWGNSGSKIFWYSNLSYV